MFARTAEWGRVTTNLREQLQATLGDSYALERELGGGGMSRVFVAEEARLGRRVVVKVLAPELTEGMSAERFEREVRLAARLQHPNIVPVLASGERGGLAYYTMPYVEGESLRERLARQGRLPLDTAVSVLRDVARALEYAHGHGVVHRDIKPENILLSGSAAAVADFGIAKALDAARTAGALGSVDTSDQAPGMPETLTRVGTSLGTPAYIAPEQAAGDPNVDGRADVYAWGVVAYELLAGTPPFVGRAAHQLIVAHIGEPPPPLAVRAPELPVALAALVMRCLEKDPAKRPQSATEVLATLEVARTPSGALPSPEALPKSARETSSHRRRRMAAAALLVLVLVIAGGVIAYRASRPAAHEQPVLAVLPFENFGLAGDAYFADGLTEEVRGRLARVPGLKVIGGASARQYKGTAKPARQIARELGATHLLTASVLWERRADGGGRVRVHPELVRVADQASVWSEAVEGPLTDVFQLQASVAEHVAAALDVALGDGDGDRRVVVSVRPTANVAAYDAYLRGLAYAAAPQETRASRRAVAEEFERAVALDSGFAAAHARLAIAYVHEHNSSGTRTRGMMERAHASANHALALDSSLVESRLAQALVLEWDGDGEGAYRAVLVAQRIAPGNAEVALRLGYIALQLGRDEEAIAAFRRAEQLEPRMALAPGMLAAAYEAVGQYEDALAARERAIALEPMVTAHFVNQAAIHLLWHADTAAARQSLDRADPGPLVEALALLPNPHRGGRTLWIGVLPPAVLRAKDTMTLAAFLREGQTPDLFQLMKARHFWMTGRPARARAHADSIIAILAPALRRGEPDTASLLGLYTKRTTLAEALAYAGRPNDAAPLLDSYVDSVRGGWSRTYILRPAYALVTAAYVDVLIGRPDSAVARLEEALRTPPGPRWISPALLRADPWWAPLRGHAGFERLIAGVR
jgi:eukaryotic-like serine/threonine-protein kinase